MFQKKEQNNQYKNKLDLYNNNKKTAKPQPLCLQDNNKKLKKDNNYKNSKHSDQNRINYICKIK